MRASLIPNSRRGKLDVITSGYEVETDLLLPCGAPARASRLVDSVIKVESWGYERNMGAVEVMKVGLVRWTSRPTTKLKPIDIYG